MTTVGLSTRVLRALQRRCKHDPRQVTADVTEGDFYGGPGGVQAIQWCRRCGAYRRVFFMPAAQLRFGDWTRPGRF